MDSCDLSKAKGSTVNSIHGTGISLLAETDFMDIRIKSAAVSIETEIAEGIEIEHNQEADRMARMIAQ